jgi:hypothetical protein
VAADEVLPRIGERGGGGRDVALDVLGEVALETGAQPGLTMSTSMSASWSGRWMKMLSGEWLVQCHARSMRSPPISTMRRSWKVSSGAGRAGSSSRRRRLRVSSCPIRATVPSNSDEAPAWSAWWWE